MKKLLFILVCLPAVFFTACNKELSDNFTVYTNHPLNDTVWVRNVSAGASVNDCFDALFPDNILIDTFNTALGGSIHFGDSISIEFPANAFTGSGNSGGSGVFTGNAKVLVIPIRRKGDFIKFFKPTTTRDGSLLETGGGLYIRIFNDDKELSLVQGASIRIRFNDEDVPKNNMQAFYGKETFPFILKGIDTGFSWLRDTDTSWLPIWYKTAVPPAATSYAGYEINAKQLRWISAERYIDSSLPKAKLTTILPPNFTNKNTAVFTVFANQKTVVDMQGDYPSRSFYANNIPLKSTVKLVSISKIGDDFYLGTENVSSVDAVTIHKITPVKKSVPDILAYLNGL